MNNTAVEKYLLRETQNYHRRTRKHHPDTKEFKHSSIRRKLLEMADWYEELIQARKEEEYVFI